MRHLKIRLLLILTFFFTTIAFAQRAEVGVNLGGASYLGDLNQYDIVKISGVSAGAFVKLNLNPIWGIGLYYQYGRVKANDASSKNPQFVQRNLNFRTPLNEFSLIGDFNFFDLFTNAYLQRRFTPYIFAGVGLVTFDPKTEYMDETYRLRLYNTEGQISSYKKFVLTFPYGAGIKYKLTESFTFISNIGYRSPLTDYIDDVSGLYPAKNSWPDQSSVTISRALSDRSGENGGTYIGEPRTQRGDFRKRDNYMFVGIGISYTFVGQKCFTF